MEECEVVHYQGPTGVSSWRRHRTITKTGTTLQLNRINPDVIAIVQTNIPHLLDML